MRLFKTHQFDQVQAYELGWSFTGNPLMTVYCYVFDDIMIDTALPHMQKETLSIVSDHIIRRVYLTHYHEDHSGNASAIKKYYKTDVYGHKITIEKMMTPFNIRPYQKYVWGKSKPVKIKQIPQKIETIFGDMIPIHTPGHSKDHLSYLLKNKGILFSGDLYLGDRIKFFRSDENIAEQINSLKKILKFDFQTLLCSHSPKQKNGKKHINKKLDFLENLYGNIILHWKKGLNEKEIFSLLKLKEHNFVKMISFGNVSMINGVRSAIKHYVKNY